MLQSLIVGVVVALAVIYSAWAFMPASWRRAGAARIAQRAGRSGVSADKAQALQARLERTSACGACATCKGCGPQKAQPRPAPDSRADGA